MRLSTGKKRWKKQKTEDYDLILMDIELPGMDGVEVTRILKNKNQNILW